MDWLDEQLSRMEQEGLRRCLKPLRPVSPVEACVDGRRVVLFSTNDYLGLSGHPRVIARTVELIQQFGMGPRAAALLSGHTELHEQLQHAIAQFKGTATALLFPTGYMANVGILQALGGRDAAIFSDELNHASIVDGCRLARSSVHVYRHADVEHLETLIRSSSAPRKIIVTDALFSMDGDVAPLPDLVSLKKRYGCLLIVDEAHSTLVYGKTGKGLAEHFDVAVDVDFQMGTLSKAFGSLGGYVATTASLRDLLIHRARSFIFTTALPVPVVAAAQAALETFREHPRLQQQLWENVRTFTEALCGESNEGRQSRSASPICPIMVGDAAMALQRSEELLKRGFHVPAIRPPTVPPGASRLRISISAAHRSSDLLALADALADLA